MGRGDIPGFSARACRARCSAWLAFALLVGCAPIPYSAELEQAERAVARAKARGAATLAPDHLIEAEQRLEDSIKAHDEDPRGIKERHLAYLAHRLAEIAEAYAETAEAEQRKEQALETRALRAEASLGHEKRARIDAERRARAAIRSLEEVARIKEERRELVITLSGAVLFKSGQVDLLPIARESLAKVAEVLKNQGEDANIVVEGHTDDRGSTRMNDNLSQARAAAVRLYLVSLGVDARRIASVGRGESEPIASNATPEGRANNRRVEIHVSR